jgi:hypothetical protein
MDLNRFRSCKNRLQVHSAFAPMGVPALMQARSQREGQYGNFVGLGRRIGHGGHGGRVLVSGAG